MKRCAACGKLMIEAWTHCRECRRAQERAAFPPNIIQAAPGIAPMLTFVIRQMGERARGE